MEAQSTQIEELESLLAAAEEQEIKSNLVLNKLVTLQDVSVSLGLCCSCVS